MQGQKPEGDKRKRGRQGRGSWVAPCDLASCCCMLVGENGEVGGWISRGRGWDPCRYTMWLVTIPSPAEREGGERERGRYTHMLGQICEEGAQTHLSWFSGTDLFVTSPLAAAFYAARPAAKQDNPLKTHTAGPAPSARPSACLSNLRRLTALLQLWLTDCVFTGVHCRGEQRRGGEKKEKENDGLKNLPGERRAANVNDGKTKKQRRLRWGRANGWTEGQIDNKTKH